MQFFENVLIKCDYKIIKISALSASSSLLLKIRRIQNRVQMLITVYSKLYSITIFVYAYQNSY